MASSSLPACVHRMHACMHVLMQGFCVCHMCPRDCSVPAALGCLLLPAQELKRSGHPAAQLLDIQKLLEQRREK